MRKLSQKELYNEGIGGFMKKAGGALGGTIGGVGGALKAASKAGTDATWGGVASGAFQGAGKGARIGSEPIKTTKDAWARARRAPWSSGNTKEDLQLVAHLETLGYIPNPTSKWGIQGRDEKTLEVIPFDWDPATGEKKPGKEIPNAMRTFKATGSSWKETPPAGGGGTLPPYIPKNAPITSSFCQKDLLRQLTLLSN